MLMTLYYLYLNIKLRLQNWYNPDKQPTNLETIFEKTEPSDSSNDRYDYNKYA